MMIIFDHVACPTVYKREDMGAEGVVKMETPDLGRAMTK
jgi:hypothetical protein